MNIERNVVLESEVTKDVFINQDLTITLVSDKEFIKDFEVADVNMEEQVLPVSSLEEKNVIKVLFKRF